MKYRLALVAVLALALAGCGSGAPSSGPSAQSPTGTVETPQPATTPLAPSAENVTPGQKNALRKAESYLEYQAFSRAGLIKQLEFEKFPTEDATYAADHVRVDWMEQAAKKAKSYLDMQAYSHDGLVKQLTFEGFSPEEAEHGATTAGV